MTVLQPTEVDAIVKDILKPRLEAAVTSEDYTLSDPATRTGSDSKFIMTSFPKRDVIYPVIILEQLTSSGNRLDVRQLLYQHQISIRMLVISKQKSQCFTALAGIREVLERDYITFSEAGMINIRTTGQSPPTFNPGSNTYTMTITFQCDSYSQYVET